MPTSNRKQRLESLLHREIATTIQRELKDPRIGLVTITRVEMTEDLHNVKAFYTVYGNPAQRRSATRALDDARSYVQNAYAPVLRTRLLPILTFAYDENEIKRQKMDELISRARSTDSDGGERPEPSNDKSMDLPPRPQPTDE